MEKKKITVTDGQLREIIKESVNKVLSEANDETVPTKKKDRHREGYWKERWQKQKAEKAKETSTSENKPKKSAKDRHRPGYYRDYNMKHPERLNRGFTKGYNNGNISDGRDDGNIYFDELGRPHNRDFYNPTMSDLIDQREDMWHDDNWYEGWNND